MEFDQPVIIRLVPTSSIPQSDQSGTPAPIMDSRQFNKRKSSHLYRPDSPNIEPRSKVSRHYHSGCDSTSTRQSRHEQHYQPTPPQPILVPITTTRKEHNQIWFNTTKEPYYVQKRHHNSKSNCRNHHSSDRLYTHNKHNQHHNSGNSTKTNHRGYSHNSSERSTMSPVPVQSHFSTHIYNHNAMQW